MAVADAVQTFAGITNENEFYSHHYLAEVFKGDIKARIDAWLEREDHTVTLDERVRAPFKQLASWTTRWFALRAELLKVREPRARLTLFQEHQQGLLMALGYAPSPAEHVFVAGAPVPVWQVLGDAHQAPRLALVPAYNPGQEDDDPLEQRLASLHYRGLPVPSALDGEVWASIVSD